MKIKDSDITFLIPIYNTDLDCFKKHVESMRKFNNSKIIYWNDGITDKVIIDILENDVGTWDNVEIFSSEVNIGLEYTIYLLSLKVKTKYIVRVDSDDEYHAFPENDGGEDFDVLLFEKCAMTFFDMFDTNMSWNGSILKADLYRDAVSVFEKFNEKHMTNWVNEDTYWEFSILIGLHKGTFNTKLVRCSCGSRRPKRCMHGFQTTTYKVTRPKIKMWDTFLLWCVAHDEFELYRNISIKFFGLAERISHRIDNHGRKLLNDG